LKTGKLVSGSKKTPELPSSLQFEIWVGGHLGGKIRRLADLGGQNGCEHDLQSHGGFQQGNQYSQFLRRGHQKKKLVTEESI